jgi:uncharacterized protein YgiM (DUF1202 family)
MSVFVRPLLLSVLLLLMLPSAAFGATNDNLAFTIGCEGFTSAGGSMLLTRDNTGDNREAFVVSAVDAAGTRVFAPLQNAVLVGSRVSFGEGVRYPWTTAPTTNPITLTIVSTAGNGLPEQTVYRSTGACADLPSASPQATPAAGAGAPPLSGNLVSPSVLPGQTPPVPSSDTAAIEQLPGYAIVNAELLNLRSGDGAQYTPVARARGGTRAAVVARNEDFSWWLLDIGGYRGWASAEFLYLRGDLTDVPVVEPQGRLIPASFVVFVSQPIFARPTDLRSAFICNAVPGEFIVAGRDDSGTYYQIDAQCADGTTATGWIDAENGAIRNPAGVRLPVTYDE